ncbi:MAG: ADOP family duplicated permease [Gemmatimonadales bacterium]
MREWWSRLWDWFRRDALDRELREELQFHAEQLERDARANGVPEPARQARVRLGNVTGVREAARRRWSWPWLENAARDVAMAFRSLRRTPSFTLTVVLTLALGIGANAAMFGMIDELMFRPYPYLRDPGRVNRVYLSYDFRGERVTNGNGLEYARFLDLERWSSRFSRFAGFSERTLAVGSGVNARERRVAAVSGAFFEFFDAAPVAGRFLGPADDVPPTGSPVSVLSYGFWKSEFGGKDVIGQRLRVRNLDTEIIGVAPEGFIGVAGGKAPEVYLPITAYAGSQAFQAGDYLTSYNWGWMAVMARRKDGVTEQEAATDLTAAYVRSWTNERETSGGVAPAEEAHPTALAGPLKVAAGPGAGLEAQTLLWVTGVAVVVLLIACANVTNLMLARVVSRRRENAVRLALGVGRGRLLAQGLTESAVLALLGCLAGLAVAQWGGAVLRRLFLEDRTLTVLTDRRTLLVSLGASVLAALVTGAGPALLAGRGDLVGGLKSGGRQGGHARGRARSALLVLQAALSVILLVGAGLFVRSLNRVQALRLGYDAERVLAVSTNLRGAVLTAAEHAALDRRLLDAALATPGVEHGTLVSSVPFWSTSSMGFFVPGIDSVRKLGRFTYQEGTPDYFATMGTRVLRGRGFEAGDRYEPPAGPRAVVVSESMAKVLWPGQDALGQCLKIGKPDAPCTVVVGIAEDAIQSSLTEDQRFRYYLPYVGATEHGAEAILLRLRDRPADRAEELRVLLQRQMPGEGYVTTMPLAQLVDGEQRSWRLGATMFVAFGGLALLVAAVGLYGVITYNVTQRMPELGIRTALGAQGRDLFRLVVVQGVRLAAIGAVIGLVVSAASGPLIEPLLFRQSARDPVVYGAVAAVLFAVAVLASAAPARRATRADPNSALKAE